MGGEDRFVTPDSVGEGRDRMGVKRILSGIVLIPILYIVVWLLPPDYFVLLVMFATGIGQYEFYRMAQARGIRPLVITGILLGILYIINFAQPLLPDMGISFIILFSLFVIMIVRLFAPRPVEGSLEDISSTFLGIFYVALLLGYQVALVSGIDGKRWLFFMYIVIWASDTGAYYIGSAFGRHKLYSKVSPKKSIEGLVGGLLLAVGAALLCRAWFLSSMGTGEAVALGIILSGAGVLGDLAESLFKRGAGVKDSGSLIPGHGGVLDRLDSVLFAAPVLFYYLLTR